jgi:hypothetical protein
VWNLLIILVCTAVVIAILAIFSFAGKAAAGPNITPSQLDGCRQRLRKGMNLAQVEDSCDHTVVPSLIRSEGVSGMQWRGWDGHRSLQLTFRYGRLVGIESFE